jgi:hypothetical protein
MHSKELSLIAVKSSIEFCVMCAVETAARLFVQARVKASVPKEIWDHMIASTSLTEVDDTTAKQDDKPKAPNFSQAWAAVASEVKPLVPLPTA